MKTNRIQRFLSFSLCLVLIAAMALMAVGCDKAEDGLEKTITFNVVDAEGVSTSFTITTERAYLADALLDEGLVEGEDSSTGLYVKKVNGIRADYEQGDGAYWALYVDGESSMVGCSSVELADGHIYEFRYTKA